MTQERPRMPDFIIIGSMKSGTTTLHEDLDRHPDIVMSSWKEPGYFVGPDFGGPAKLPLTAARTPDYLKLFKHVRNDQICGESSTHYTKMPKLPNAAQHIYDTLGAETKLIYVMRDPVKRAVSQYGHEFQHGEIDIATLGDAIESYPPIVDTSRYAMQLAPYQALFPAENILCLKFENIVKDRQAYIERVLTFLGADVLKMPTLDDAPVRNTAEARRSWYSWARKLRNWPFFKTIIEPHVPHGLLKFLQKLVTKKPKPVVLGGERADLEARIKAKLSPEDLAVYEAAL